MPKVYQNITIKQWYIYYNETIYVKTKYFSKYKLIKTRAFMHYKTKLSIVIKVIIFTFIVVCAYISIFLNCV